MRQPVGQHHMEREYDFGIYRRPGGRFIVRRFDESIPGLWAPLGVWYDRAKAEKLAEALTQEAQEGNTRAKRNRNTSI